MSEVISMPVLAGDLACLMMEAPAGLKADAKGLHALELHLAARLPLGCSLRPGVMLESQALAPLLVDGRFVVLAEADMGVSQLALAIDAVAASREVEAVLVAVDGVRLARLKFNGKRLYLVGLGVRS